MVTICNHPKHCQTLQAGEFLFYRWTHIDIYIYIHIYIYRLIQIVICITYIYIHIIMYHLS